MNAVTQLVEPSELKFAEEDEYDGGQEPYVFPWPEGRHDCAMNDTREANASGINIHGKRYTTVATRVEIFRRHFGVFGRLRITQQTETDGVITMTAAVELRAKDGWELVAEGRAEEVRSNTGINSTSALEVCETSAYGRALANFGLAGGEFASANEVEQAIKKQGDRSGRPDTSGVDQAEVQSLVEDFTFALSKSDIPSVLSTHDKIATKEALYTAVWDRLSSKQTTALRKIISERK